MVRRLLVTLLALSAQATALAGAGFADFDRRARAGERLVVVFFGASLTWGANASDPNLTSYRAEISDRLEAAYPMARLKFFDAAIGGTGSQLGAFRLERDVLRRKPDLVFLDFSANDDIYSGDPEQNASYESLVRRLVLEAECPVVVAIFPFLWNVKQGNTGGMKRREAHLEIAKAYNVPAGDAISLAIERVKKGETTIEKLWPFDGVHPGDEGYQLFADAAWAAFQDGVKNARVCKAPEKMLFADTYMTWARVRLSSLGAPPAGWRVGRPSPTAAFHDMLMSRWLDDVVVATSRKREGAADGKDAERSEAVGRLAFRVKAKFLMLFGEATLKSGRFRLHIDGKPRTYVPPRKKEATELYEPRPVVQGTMHYVMPPVTDLDPAVEHLVEIEPVFDADKEQELRLESVCVAGGEAKVLPVGP